MALALRIPRLLGEINDKDTQFSAAVKKYQEFVLLGAVVVIVAIAYYAISYYIDNSGRQGTWRYGLCKVFLEQYAFYPDTVIVLDSLEKQSGAMIRYMATTPYGGQESQEMECFYNIAPAGITLSRVTVERKSLNLLNEVEKGNTVDVPADQTPLSYEEIFKLYDVPDSTSMTRKVSLIHIEEFNKSIPALLAAGKLDTKMPSEMAEELEDLKYENF